MNEDEYDDAVELVESGEWKPKHIAEWLRTHKASFLGNVGHQPRFILALERNAERRVWDEIISYARSRRDGE